MFKHSYALVPLLGLSLGLLCIHSASAFEFDKKLLAPDGAGGDFFGNSVSLSGNTALIGSFSDDDNGFQSGSAYLFDVTTGNLLHKLIAPDGFERDFFGLSVSLSGNIALVGSPNSVKNINARTGSAYLFDVTTGNLLHRLTAPDGADNDRFGGSVSLSGNTALVGSFGDNDNGNSSGSVYLFDVTTGNLLRKLTAPDSVVGGQFGKSVSLSGNIALVGSEGDDGNGFNSGSAYLFDVTTGNFLHKLIGPDTTTGDSFGNSVSLSGNIALVGSVFDDNGNLELSGSAYLFDVTTGNFIRKLTAPDGAANDRFGISVSLLDNTALVGSFGDDNNGDDIGSAYVFDVTTGNLLQKLTAPDGADDDDFGRSVSLSGNTALVSSFGDDDNGNSSGSAYIFINEVTPNPEKIPEPSLILGLLTVGSLGALVSKRK